MSNNEEWSQYWANEGAQGEVFVDADGNKHPEIAKFWFDYFENIPNDANVVDLASGAGSIFNSFDNAKYPNLAATDISSVALNTLKQRLPHIDVFECASENLPFDNQSQDYVVSQFGLEYAGEAGFLDAARVLKHEGEIRCIVHIENGYIDKRNAQELKGVGAFNALGFLTLARACIEALGTQETLTIQNAMAQFSTVEPLAYKLTQTIPKGMHAHAYEGAKQLIQGYSKYAPKDVFKWIDNMQVELAQCEERLTHMRSVAFSENRMQALAAQLKSTHQLSISYQTLTLSGHSVPVAWIVKG